MAKVFGPKFGHLFRLRKETDRKLARAPFLETGNTDAHVQAGTLFGRPLFAGGTSPKRVPKEYPCFGQGLGFRV